MIEQATYMTAVVAIALIAIGPILGVWTSRSSKVKQSTDSSLRFGTTVTGLSAAAAGNGAFILVGAVGLGYTMGVSSLGIAVGFWIGDILFWYLMARHLIGRVQESGVEEICELIAAQSSSAKLLPLRVAAAVVVIAVGLYCVAQFLAVGKTAIELFGLSQFVGMSIVIVLGLISILFGGLASSIIVNVYQAVLMILSALLLLLFVGVELAANPDVIRVTPETSRLLHPLGTFTPMEMFLFSGTFVCHGFLFATCNPNVLARITKGSVDEIPRIRWVYMGFMQSLWWLMTFAGVALALLSVAASDPDSVGVAFAESRMAAPLLGLFLAGIAAASMSTGEAQLLVIANALTKDVWPEKFKSLSENAKRNVLIVSRLFVAGCLLVAMMTMNSQLIGFLVIQAGSIILTAFAVPALLFVFKVSISGHMMALSILAGASTTIWVRLSFAPPPGQEVFAGWAVTAVIAAVALIIQRKQGLLTS